jgi:hypothetical protein
LKTYRGACHCGRIRFRSCDCSIILPFRRPRHLTEQEIARGLPHFSGWAINVRCLEGVDLDAIPIRRVHGSKLE